MPQSLISELSVLTSIVVEYETNNNVKQVLCQETTDLVQIWFWSLKVRIKWVPRFFLLGTLPQLFHIRHAVTISVNWICIFMYVLFWEGGEGSGYIPVNTKTWYLSDCLDVLRSYFLLATSLFFLLFSTYVTTAFFANTFLWKHNLIRYRHVSITLYTPKKQPPSRTREGSSVNFCCCCWRLRWCLVTWFYIHSYFSNHISWYPGQGKPIQN